MTSIAHEPSFLTRKKHSQKEVDKGISWISWAEEEDDEVETSPARKYLLLLAFSFAQFLDALNVSALVTAIPAVSLSLHFVPSEAVWLLSAYQLTFAAFLLLSGRLADLFNAKYLFLGGFASLGLISIGAGFVNNKIVLLVLRAFTGISAAATIPSALHLIVHLFPGKSEQEMAISIFGGSAAIGNVMGIVIGALFEQYTSWRWIFWFNACVALPITALCLFALPEEKSTSEFKQGSTASKIQRLDLFGVSLLTVGFLLFIFGLTTAPTEGWGTPKVLVPIIVSVFLVTGFLFYEAYIPDDKAALPPKVWFYPNFGVLFGLALLPFFWFGTLFLLFTPLWQSVYGWSPITSATRMLPLGLTAFPTVVVCAALQKKVRLKTFLLAGSFLLMVGTLLLPFGDRPSRFWPIIFPALFIGAAGATIIYANANIGMFKFTPSAMAGTVGAVFNSALQLGAAVGLAIVTSIETNVEKSRGGFASYNGRAAAFWFLFAISVVIFFSILFLIRDQEIQNEEKSLPDIPSDTETHPRRRDPPMRMTMDHSIAHHPTLLRAKLKQPGLECYSVESFNLTTDVKPRTYV